jgi:hypothetical protein
VENIKTPKATMVAATAKIAAFTVPPKHMNEDQALAFRKSL